MSAESRMSFDGTIEEVEFPEVNLLDLLARVQPTFRVENDVLPRLGLDGVEDAEVPVITDHNDYTVLFDNSKKEE